MTETDGVIVWVTVSEFEKLHGVAGMCTYCPVALGIQNVLRPDFSAEVSRLCLVLCEKTADPWVSRCIYACRLPSFVAEFVLAFDRSNGYVDAWPFSALLHLPRRAVRLDVPEAMSYDAWQERNLVAEEQEASVRL